MRASSTEGCDACCSTWLSRRAPSYEEALTRPIVHEPDIVVQYTQPHMHVDTDIVESPSLARGTHQVSLLTYLNVRKECLDYDQHAFVRRLGVERYSDRSRQWRTRRIRTRNGKRLSVSARMAMNHSRNTLLPHMTQHKRVLSSHSHKHARRK